MKQQQELFLKRVDEAANLLMDAGYSIHAIVETMEEKFSDPGRQPTAKEFNGVLSILRVLGNSLQDNSEDLQMGLVNYQKQ